MKKIIALMLFLLLLAGSATTFSAYGEEAKTTNTLANLVSSDREEFYQKTWYGSVEKDGINTYQLDFFENGVFLISAGAGSLFDIYMEGEYTLEESGNYLLSQCYAWDGEQEHAGNYAIVVEDAKMELTLLSRVDDLPGILPFQEEGDTVTLSWVDGDTLDISEIEWQDDEIVAFFYSDSYPDTTMSLVHRMSLRYDFPNTYYGVTYINCESYYPGQSEGYVVIPRDEDAEVIVESLELDDSGNLVASQLEYDGSGVVSVETGITEFIPRVRITVRSAGREVVIEPVRGGRDGSMALPEEGVLGIEITKAEVEYGDEVIRQALPHILAGGGRSTLQADAEYAWSVLSLAIQHCTEGWISRDDYVNDGPSCSLKVPGRDVRAWAYMLFNDLEAGEVPPEEGLGRWNSYDPASDMYSFMFADGPAIVPEVADKVVNGDTTVLVLHGPSLERAGFALQAHMVFVKDPDVPEELGGRRLVNLQLYYLEHEYY